MHPRNRYSKNKADFGELAEFRPSLKPFLVKRVRWRNSNTPSTRTPNAPPLATGAAPPTGTPDIPPTGAVLPTGVPDAPLTGNPEAPPTGTSDAGAPNSPDAPATLPTGTPYAPPTGTPDDPLIVTPEAPPTGTSSDAGGPNAPSNIIAKKFAYTLNFSNIDAIRELSCALLEKDFDLRVEIPVGCLVPTVPQKLNYIHWVEDLLSCGACEEQIPRGKDVVGIDVGTGMTCVYPLLGSRINKWRFVATDISEEAVECATRNVSANSLQDHIEVKLVSMDAMLKDVVEPSISCYAFSMCNPPFFRSVEEKLGGTGDSLRPAPSTVNSGSESETVTQGGEVQFVKRMIEDSLVLRNRVRWYTSMLGKRSSLKDLHSELKSCQVPVITTTEFVQGKTWRWGLAWSFDETLKNKVVKLSRHRNKWQQHFSLQMMGKNGHPPCPSPAGVNRVREWLLEEWNLLEINATVESCEESCDATPDLAGVTMRCVAERVTWTNQRKVKRLKAKLPHSSFVLPGVDEIAKSALEAEVLKIQTEIHTLCKPCKMEFAARITLQGEDVRRGRKGKTRNKGGRQERLRARDGKGRKGKVETVEGSDEMAEGRNGEGSEMDEGGEGRKGGEVEGVSGTDEVGGRSGKAGDEEKMAEGEVRGEGRKRKLDEHAGEEGDSMEGVETLGSGSEKITGVEEGEAEGKKEEQRRAIGDGGGRKREIEVGEGEDVEGKKKRKMADEEEEQTLENSSVTRAGVMAAEGEDEAMVEIAVTEQPRVGKAEKKVCVELEWRSGVQEIDLLHRLLQYLQNKMTSIDFEQ